MTSRPADRFSGYSHLSVILHWTVAVIIGGLYFTTDNGSMPVHLALGIVATPLLLVRLFRRFGRGYPRIPNQPLIFNLVERLITFAFLLCLLAAVLTGLLMPILDGRPIVLPGLAPIDLPFPGDPETLQFLKAIHEIAGNAFVPLVLLHVLAALKHHFIDRDSVTSRMFRPMPHGR